MYASEDTICDSVFSKVPLVTSVLLKTLIFGFICHDYDGDVAPKNRAEGEVNFDTWKAHIRGSIYFPISRMYLCRCTSQTCSASLRI